MPAPPDTHSDAQRPAAAPLPARCVKCQEPTNGDGIYCQRHDDEVGAWVERCAAEPPLEDDWDDDEDWTLPGLPPEDTW